MNLQTNCQPNGELGLEEPTLSWTPLGPSHKFCYPKPTRVVVGDHEIVVVRPQQGQVYALENACLHKGVELHLGDIEGENVVCPYHGWQFKEDGSCVAIPYLPDPAKCPKARIRAYRVVEKSGVIWALLGQSADEIPTHLPEIPFYGRDDVLRLDLSPVCADQLRLMWSQSERPSGKDHLPTPLVWFTAPLQSNQALPAPPASELQPNLTDNAALYVFGNSKMAPDAPSFAYLFIAPRLPAFLWKPFRKQWRWVFSKLLVASLSENEQSKRSM